MKYYNKGIAAHLEAIPKLQDDDHLVFENLQGQGPIDIITVNKQCVHEVETYLLKQGTFYKNLGIIDNSTRVLKFPDKSSISLNSINKYLKIWQKRFST